MYTVQLICVQLRRVIVQYSTVQYNDSVLHWGTVGCGTVEFRLPVCHPWFVECHEVYLTGGPAFSRGEEHLQYRATFEALATSRYFGGHVSVMGGEPLSANLAVNAVF